jgi:hypothetical protein
MRARPSVSAISSSEAAPPPRILQVDDDFERRRGSYL